MNKQFEDNLSHSMIAYDSLTNKIWIIGGNINERWWDSDSDKIYSYNILTDELIIEKTRINSKIKNADNWCPVNSIIINRTMYMTVK